MQFKDVAGQDHLKQQLIQLVAQDRLPHALMLNGQAGTGGFALALALAQYINCTDKQEQDSCGQCHACESSSTLMHPDLTLSFPIFNRKTKADKESINSEVKRSADVKSVCASFIKEFRSFILDKPYAEVRDWFDFLGASNKQANIPKAECSEIIKKMHLRPLLGGYKILLIWKPEYLKKEGNALLKLIEEPPGKSLFLFVTEDMDKILGTIQSRTQLFSLRPLPSERIEDYLRTKNVPETSVSVFASMAEGNMHKRCN